MIDRSLLHTLLSVLHEQHDLAGGTPESALFNDCNLRATVPVTTSLLREHLEESQLKGWVSHQYDELREKRWRLTPQGRDFLRDLRNGR